MFRKIMMIIFYSAGTLVIGQPSEKADPGRARNSVQLSFGGAGVYYSVLYERLLFTSRAWHAGVKTGIGTTLSPALSPPEFSIPMGGYVLYGKGNSKLDFGLSFTGYIMWQHDHEMERRFMELQPLIIPSLAYRYQKNEGGFMFRAGLSSMIHINGITPVYAPWIDLGVGYVF